MILVSIVGWLKFVKALSRMTWIVGFTKVIRQCVVTTSCCATVGEFLKFC